MKNIAIAFLSGVVVTLLGIAIYLLRNSKPVIHADQYIAELEQKVSKIKQRGEGNTQSTELSQEPTQKENRTQNRRERKAKRKGVLSATGNKQEI